MQEYNQWRKQNEKARQKAQNKVREEQKQLQEQQKLQKTDLLSHQIVKQDNKTFSIIPDFEDPNMLLQQYIQKTVGGQLSNQKEDKVYEVDNRVIKPNQTNTDYNQLMQKQQIFIQKQIEKQKQQGNQVQSLNQLSINPPQLSQQQQNIQHQYYLQQQNLQQYHSLQNQQQNQNYSNNHQIQQQQQLLDQFKEFNQLNEDLQQVQKQSFHKMRKEQAIQKKKLDPFEQLLQDDKYNPVPKKVKREEPVQINQQELKSAKDIQKFITNEQFKNPQAFLQIQINGKQVGRIVIELFQNVVPKTVQNFLSLCSGEYGTCYRNTIFHRIIPGFMCQGGQINSLGGKKGESIYGARFADENFVLKHDQPFLLSMANSGPNTNGTQFFITVAKCGWLDGKHVVFGKVVQGEWIVRKMELVGQKDGSITQNVMVVDSGILNEQQQGQEEIQQQEETFKQQEEQQEVQKEQFNPVNKFIPRQLKVKLQIDQELKDLESKYQQIIQQDDIAKKDEQKFEISIDVAVNDHFQKDNVEQIQKQQLQKIEDKNDKVQTDNTKKALNLFSAYDDSESESSYVSSINSDEI